MVKAEIVTWVQTEFKPLNIVTPVPTVEQAIDNAIRYWNTHSGYKWIEMVSATTPRVQLSKYFRAVVKVYPSSAAGNNIFQGHPLWSLLGMTILDNVTSDIILLTEAFKSYSGYIGTSFQWSYVKNEDPEEGGYLYTTNIPAGSEKLAVMGTRRIFADEDIVSDYILDWLLRYTKALIKQVEGNTLRKSDIIGVKNDGQALYDEGKEEVKDLQEQLHKDGRWVALARRF